MADFEIKNVIDWIEAHPNTIDLIKWTALGILAWLTGIFTYIRNLTRSPKVSISSVTSRCYIESIKHNNYTYDLSCAAFLLEIEVINPSNQLIVIRDFAIQFRLQHPFFCWSKKLTAISLPNQVRHQTGASVKLLKNWFSKFSDDFDLTADSKIESKDTKSAFILFVSSTHKKYAPQIKNNEVYVRVIARLTTGQKIKAFKKVHVTYDADFFEKMTPGILAQIRHPTAWGAYANF